MTNKAVAHLQDALDDLEYQVTQLGLSCQDAMQRVAHMTDALVQSRRDGDIKKNEQDILKARLAEIIDMMSKS